VTDHAARLTSALAEKYRVERELGRGGMATVYLAHDLQHDRKVAVKVLHPDLGAALGPERFRREIQVLTRLSHPHILPLYDFGEADEHLYYVMPYIGGKSLATRLEREQQLPLDEAIAITCQVASALDYAHRQGFVHRDVKPANILLEDGQAIVADFGIAHVITSAGDEQLTKTGVTLGTPAYMSPEQAMAERDLDGRSDVYSLGCVLYEMLAGQPPFTGPTAQSIIARHALEHVPSITIVRETVPPEVEDAITQAMAKARADRFKSAAEFADALRGKIRATSTHRFERHGARRTLAEERRARLRRNSVVGAGALVLLLGGGFAAWRLNIQPTRIAAAGTVDTDPLTRKLAVLYFTDESDGQLAYLADGLTESLIDELSRVSALDVVSRAGVRAFRHVDLPRDSIARALDVGTLIIGSVEPSGGGVRVTLRLVDASGAEFQNESFEERTADPIALRSKLASQAATLLRQRIGESIRLRDLRLGTKHPQAWALVQRAENGRKRGEDAVRANDRGSAERVLLAADSQATVAGRLDPAWTEPLTLRADIAYIRARIASPLDARAITDSGVALASRAIELAPNDAAAYESRGALRYRAVLDGLASDPRSVSRLVDDAEKDLRRAVELDANRANAWVWLSRLYYRKLNITGAYAAAENAYRADAYLTVANEVFWRLFATSYDLENFVPAAQWCADGTKRFPADPRFVRCRLLMLTPPSEPPDVDRAWRLVDSLAALSPAAQREYNRREAQVLAALVIGRGALTDTANRTRSLALRDSAERVLVRARPDRTIDPRGELMGYEAFVRAQIGDKAGALSLIERYLTANPEHREGFGKLNSWWWRPLKDDPRYNRIVGVPQ
jgi:serine/threonine-protein kinase